MSNAADAPKPYCLSFRCHMQDMQLETTSQHEHAQHIPAGQDSPPRWPPANCKSVKSSCTSTKLSQNNTLTTDNYITANNQGCMLPKHSIRVMTSPIQQYSNKRPAPCRDVACKLYMLCAHAVFCVRSCQQSQQKSPSVACHITNVACQAISTVPVECGAAYMDTGRQPASSLQTHFLPLRLLDCSHEALLGHLQVRPQAKGGGGLVGGAAARAGHQSELSGAQAKIFSPM
jgi:hypothetical protein